MIMGQGLYGLPEPALPEKPKRRLGWVSKTLIAIAVLTGVSLLTLHWLGGNSDSLKSSVESYLKEETGYQAHIRKLNALEFYPVVGVDMSNMILSDGKEAVAHFQHVNFGVGFWGAASGSSLRSLDIRSGIIRAGVLAPGGIRIERFFIDMEDPKAPVLRFKGQYNEKPLTFSVMLKSKRTLFGAMEFSLHEEARFSLRAGDIEAEGIARDNYGERRFDIERLVVGKGAKPVRGSVAVSMPEDGLGVDGTIEAGITKLVYDITSLRDKDDRVIKGRIEAENLDLDDVLKDDGLVHSYNTLRAFYDPEWAAISTKSPYDFSKTVLDVDFKTEHLYKGGVDLGSVNIPFKIRDGKLTGDPVSGSIKGGKLDGKIVLDATQVPAALGVELQIAGADYTALSPMIKSAENAKGRAEVKVNMTSKGNNSDQLWSAMDGKALVIAGPGELTTPMIALWGGGLLNTMLPSFDKSDRLALNCGIGDFLIDDGRAKTKTFFFDTDRVVVVGDGSINLQRGTINMKLEPKSKDTAFFSAATAVNLSGPLDHPRIEPNAFSLGKKLGSLFLGAINPVYLAFSLTDLGVDDKHPCRAYLKP